MTWSFFTLQFTGAVGFGPCSFHPRAHHIYQGTNSEPQNRTRRRWLDRTGRARQWESASANTICILLGEDCWHYSWCIQRWILKSFDPCGWILCMLLMFARAQTISQLKSNEQFIQRTKFKSEFLDISTWHNMTAFNTPQIIENGCTVTCNQQINIFLPYPNPWHFTNRTEKPKRRRASPRYRTVLHHWTRTTSQVPCNERWSCFFDETESPKMWMYVM